MKVCDVMHAANLKLRLKALFVDYVTIVAYLLILAIVTLSSYFFIFGGFPQFSESQSHWVSFFTTVLPISVYYTIREMKLPYQTFGKTKLGLAVNYKGNPLTGSILRNALKFLPWQLGHYAVIKGIYHNDFSIRSVLIPYALSLGLPILYIGMVALRKDHRHLPDLIGKSQVVGTKEKG